MAKKRKGSNQLPAITEAIAVLRNDSSCELDFAVIGKWYAKLPKIENALAKLSKAEIETFTIGEPEEMAALRKRVPSLKLADEFLNEVFEG